MTTVRLHAVTEPFSGADRYALRRAEAFAGDLQGDDARWLEQALRRLNRALDDIDWYGVPGAYSTAPDVIAAACDRLAAAIVHGIPQDWADPQPGEPNREVVLRSASAVLLRHPISPSDAVADQHQVPDYRRKGSDRWDETLTCPNAARFRGLTGGCFC